MKTELTGIFELSAEPGKGADREIEKVIMEVNRNLSIQGAKVESVELKGKILRIHLVSERLRAHQAFISLKKPLISTLGKKFRVGIREGRVETYMVGLSLQRPPIKKVTVPFDKIGLNGELSIEGTDAELHLRDIDFSLLQKNWVDRIINLVKEKIEKQYYQGKKEYWKLLWQSKPRKREIEFNADPTEEMLKQGWIKQGPTKGKWFFYPPAAAVLEAMDRIAVNEVLLPLKFQEVIEPHHVPLEIWLKTGHIKSIPGEIYYVSEPLSRSEEEWEDFTDIVKITNEIPYKVLRMHLDEPRCGICYAQCPVIYWSLKGKTLADGGLPLMVFERRAISNRYESGGRHGIERVDEFHRIEPVYVGYRKQLLDLKEKLLERYRYVFNELLELDWRMAWVTPFYMAQAGEVYEEKSEEKDQGTIDFEAWLPYRGEREKSEWLEFQNLSIVGERYTKAFNIKGQKGNLWSGCSGIGLERWMAAFLGQHSLNPKNWPEGFRRYLPKLPDGIKFL
jgi:seryl-tRNA synthetase